MNKQNDTDSDGIVQQVADVDPNAEKCPWCRGVMYPALLARSRLTSVAHSLRTGLLPQRGCTPDPVHGRGSVARRPPRWRSVCADTASSRGPRRFHADLIAGIPPTRLQDARPSGLAPQGPHYGRPLLPHTFGVAAVPYNGGTESLSLPVSPVAKAHETDALLPSLRRASVPTGVGTSALVEEGASALEVKVKIICRVFGHRREYHEKNPDSEGNDGYAAKCRRCGEWEWDYVDEDGSFGRSGD